MKYDEIQNTPYIKTSINFITATLHDLRYGLENSGGYRIYLLLLRQKKDYTIQ